jgi:hypothetical protein
MPKVIRLDPGGGSVVEQSELSIEQAQSLARSLKAVGEPAGCCWCVGLWDHEEEEEVAVQSPSYKESYKESLGPPAHT